MKLKAMASALRHFLYIIGAIGLTLVQYAAANSLHQATYNEGQIIENLQIALLLISSLSFLAIGKAYGKFKCISYCFSGLCALAVCRELDAFLDEALPVCSWRIGFLFVIPAVVFAIRHREKCMTEFELFTNTTGFTMMCNAFIVILPIAQMIGHNKFLRAVLENVEHVSKIKEVIEESVETYGYYLILCSAIELFFLCRKNSQRQLETGKGE